MLQGIILLVVLIIGTYWLLALRRQRHLTIKSFIDETTGQVRRLEELNRKNESGLHQIGSTRQQAEATDLDLIQIAETIVYTKRRVKTFFNTRSGNIFSLSEFPVFIGEGMEIGKDDFITFLESKSEYQARGQMLRYESLVDEDQKIIPFAKVR